MCAFRPSGSVRSCLRAGSSVTRSLTGALAGLGRSAIHGPFLEWADPTSSSEMQRGSAARPLLSAVDARAGRDTDDHAAEIEIGGTLAVAGRDGRLAISVA